MRQKKDTLVISKTSEYYRGEFSSTRIPQHDSDGRNCPILANQGSPVQFAPTWGSDGCQTEWLPKGFQPIQNEAVGGS